MKARVLIRTAAVLLILLLGAGFAVAEGSQEDGSGGRQFIRFGGGSAGGSWFPTVGGLSSYLSTYIDGLNVTAIATGGSVDNNRQARQGNLDTWLTHSLTAFENWSGTGLFDGQGEWHGFRLISGVYENHHHFVTLESSDIETFEDLRGKKVCMGNTGSGGAVNSENILKALGIWEDVDAIYMTWDEAGRALMNGQIDAMGASSAPLPAVVTLDAQRDIKLIEPTDREFQQIFEAFPSYAQSTIPGGTYSSVPEDTESVSFLVYWAVREDLPNDVVIDMLTVALDPDNREDLANIHDNLATIGPYLKPMRTFPVPLHPGAVEYYRNQGLTVPEENLPPEM